MNKCSLFNIFNQVNNINNGEEDSQGSPVEEETLVLEEGKLQEETLVLEGKLQVLHKSQVMVEHNNLELEVVHSQVLHLENRPVVVDPEHNNLEPVLAVGEHKSRAVDNRAELQGLVHIEEKGCWLARQNMQASAEEAQQQ